MPNTYSSDKLVKEFLEQAKTFQADVELLKVLKSRTYKIAEANVLVRAASRANPKYFFGLNYLTVEEIANLDNPFIAFICGSLDRTILIPAKVLFNHLDKLSHDRNGEYKINIDPDLNIVLTGRNNRLDCQKYIGNWKLLLSPPKIKEELKNTVEESLHSLLQGRLIEIGNIRGFETYSPNKSKIFNDKTLEQIITLKNCPELQFSDHQLLRLIDVIWFKSKGSNFIPEKAFEIELTTGVWGGIVRMATLLDYSNVSLYIISNDQKRFKQAISVYPQYRDRYNFVGNEALGDLYAAEINLKEIKINVGI